VPAISSTPSRMNRHALFEIAEDAHEDE